MNLRLSAADKIKLMREASWMCDYSSCGYKTGVVAVAAGTKKIKPKLSELNLSRPDRKFIGEWGGYLLLKSFNETLAGEKYCQEDSCIREELGLTGGKDIDKVCTSHAEIGLIARAARWGMPLRGAAVLATTFPCYICSKALVQVQIGALFYMSDYTTNDGQRFFDAAGIPVECLAEAEVWRNYRDDQDKQS